MPVTISLTNIPKGMHGKIIGKGGATKADIESDYSVEIAMPAAKDPSNVITITGSTNDSVKFAKSRILDICGMSNVQNNDRAKLDKLRREKDDLFKQAFATPHGPQRDKLMNMANAKRDEFDAQLAAHGEEVYRLKNQGYGNDQMDLHGLTVNQAEAKVKERLDIVDSDLTSGRLNVLTVIVGAGHHSEKGQPKIKPAIMELLRQRGYPVKVDDTGGQLFVYAKGQRLPGAAPPSAPSFLDEIMDLLSCCFGFGR